MKTEKESVEFKMSPKQIEIVNKQLDAFGGFMVSVQWYEDLPSYTKRNFERSFWIPREYVDTKKNQIPLLYALVLLTSMKKPSRDKKVLEYPKKDMEFIQEALFLLSRYKSFLSHKKVFLDAVSSMLSVANIPHYLLAFMIQLHWSIETKDKEVMRDFEEFKKSLNDFLMEWKIELRESKGNDIHLRLESDDNEKNQKSSK